MKKSVIFLTIIVLIFNIFLIQGVNVSAAELDFNAASTVQPQPYTNSYEEKKDWSEKQIKRLIEKNCNWCSDDDYCYPFGYVKKEQYCGIDKTLHFEKINFINQSESGTNCAQDFECKSNFCFNNECIGTMESLLFSFHEQINELNKDLEEEKNKTTLLREELNQIKKYLGTLNSNIDTIQLENKKKQNGITGFFVKIFG